MSRFWLILIALGALAVPAALLSSKQLRLGKDFLFLVFGAEVLIYLHGAPIVWYAHIAPALQPIYVDLSLACLLLFELPLYACYIWWFRRRPAGRGHAPVKVDLSRGTALAWGAAGSSVAFLFVVVRYHLLFLRLGAVAEARALIELPNLAYLTFRLFGVAAVGMTLILVVAASLSSRRRRRQFAGCAAIAASGYMFQRVVNSRLDVVVLFTLGFGVMLSVNPGLRIPRRLVLWGTLALLLVGYGIRVAVNARDQFVTSGSLAWSALVPWRAGNITGGGPTDLLGFRLNGLDLMAQLTPAARAQGFAWGRAWAIPALVIWNQMRLQRAANDAYLTSYLATPKRYLIIAYTTINTPDYPSTILTDVYGNFGLAGLIFAGCFMGLAFGACIRTLQQRASPAGMVVALFLLQSYLVFEADFWTVLTGWIRFLPVLVLFLVFNPFRRVRSGAAPQARMPARLSVATASFSGGSRLHG